MARRGTGRSASLGVQRVTVGWLGGAGIRLKRSGGTGYIQQGCGGLSQCVWVSVKVVGQRWVSWEGAALGAGKGGCVWGAERRGAHPVEAGKAVVWVGLGASDRACNGPACVGMWRGHLPWWLGLRRPAGCMKGGPWRTDAWGKACHVYGQPGHVSQVCRTHRGM